MLLDRTLSAGAASATQIYKNLPCQRFTKSFYLVRSYISSCYFGIKGYFLNAGVKSRQFPPLNKWKQAEEGKKFNLRFSLKKWKIFIWWTYFEISNQALSRILGPQIGSNDMTWTNHASSKSSVNPKIYNLKGFCIPAGGRECDT